MSTTRRSVLAGAATAAALTGAASADARDEAEALVRLSAEANAALMRGEVDADRALAPMSDDFTLMSPFGGKPSTGPTPPESWEAMRTFSRNGTFSQEVVETYATPDMVALVLIERATCEVGGLPAQDWALRVTLVYRREAGDWRLAHRHADPLVRGVSLEEAAALAR